MVRYFILEVPLIRPGGRGRRLADGGGDAAGPAADALRALVGAEVGEEVIGGLGPHPPNRRRRTACSVSHRVPPAPKGAGVDLEWCTVANQ